MNARLLKLTLVAAMAALAFQAQTAEPPSHEHHAVAGGALVSQLQLDDGQRWSTDAPLREGMAEIRMAFDADHPRIHSGKESDAQYDVLAAKIDASVSRIVAQCKLSPAADAQLHLIVGDLLQGVALMRGSDPHRSRHDGAALVHGALRAYPTYFDDPTPVQTGE